ncbi:MAG: ClbS/DfsB family four-helix bundle protein [Aggregatilineales bacterium]
MLEGKSKREAMGISPEVWEQDFDVINAVIQQHYKDTPLDEALKIVRQNHQHMLTKLDAMTESDLLLPFQHFHPDVDEDEPIIWWAIIATYDHFQEHMPWIKAIAEQ